jgi:hypothetical protein
MAMAAIANAAQALRELPEADGRWNRSGSVPLDGRPAVMVLNG